MRRTGCTYPNRLDLRHRGSIYSTSHDNRGPRTNRKLSDVERDMIGLAPAFPVKKRIVSRIDHSVLVIRPSHSPSFRATLTTQVPRTHRGRQTHHLVPRREAGLWSHVRDGQWTTRLHGRPLGLRLGDSAILGSLRLPVLLSGGAVAWTGKCQHSIAISSCEDEYYRASGKVGI